MEFTHFIFQAWKVREFNSRSLKVIGNLKFCLIDKLVPMTRQEQCQIERSDLCLLICLRSINTLTQLLKRF